MTNRDFLLQVSTKLDDLSTLIKAFANEDLDSSVELALDSIPPIKDESLEKASLEDVRALLILKATEGKTAKIKELLESHNAAKLSDLAPCDYETVIKEAQSL